MWPDTPPELIRLQRELARRRPAPWRPSSPRPLVAGCFVCFARGAAGPGRAGERGWAAAALMRADRRLAGTAVAHGRAGDPYHPGLLALREGRLLEAAVRALPGRPEVVGRVELHKGGFRAEYARPIALVVLEEWRDSEYGALVRRLAERYRAGVAYLHEPHELAAWCDERELGLSEQTVRSLLPAPALAQRAQPVEVVQTCGVDEFPSENGWRTRLWEEWKPDSVGDAIATLVAGVFGLFYLAFGAGIAYVIAAAIFGWLPEDDASRGADRPALHGQRALEIVDEDLVREGKRRWLYLAAVKNTGSRTALGVVPSGRLLDRNGERVASIGRPGDVEGGVNLAPGQTGAVWDEIRLHGSDPRSPSAVARIKVTAGARKLVEGAPRSPIAVRDVRPDHELCIVTATIDSRREMKRARLSLVGREHNGRLLGATKFGVGPLARGRGEYFVTRIPPRACAEPPLRLEGYPSLTTRQLRETASSR